MCVDPLTGKPCEKEILGDPRHSVVFNFGEQSFEREEFGPQDKLSVCRYVADLTCGYPEDRTKSDGRETNREYLELAGPNQVLAPLGVRANENTRRRTMKLSVEFVTTQYGSFRWNCRKQSFLAVSGLTIWFAPMRSSRKSNERM